MSPPVPEIRRDAGRRVSRLREPNVTSYASRGPASINDENWLQTLTLNILLNQMNVQNAPHQYAFSSYRFGRIRDSNNRSFIVRDWRPQEWTSFVRRFEDVTEEFWSRRFLLIPPTSYDGLNWPRRRPTHRPNVLTDIDVNIDTQTGRASYPSRTGWRPISIWKLATREEMPGPNVRLPRGLRQVALVMGMRSFRSNTGTMVRADAYERGGRTAIHEVGHHTGQNHPGVWPGVRVRGCARGNQGADACYVGTRQEHRDNIMGLGRGILPQNADPWRDLIAEHTSTQEVDWRIHVIASNGVPPSPASLTTQSAGRQPAGARPARTATPTTP